MGPPGAGKGTQAHLLSEKLNIPHISTGEIFRNHMKNQTSLGEEIREIMESGLMVNDDLSIRIAEDAIRGKESWILDGFPRSEIQAIWTLQKFPKAYYVFINTSKEECSKRVQERLLKENRPEDATPESITNRWNEYKSKTAPAIDHVHFFGRLKIVDGDQAVEKVFNQLCRAVQA